MADTSNPVSAAPLPTLHLLGRFSELYTGAERELLDLRDALAGRRTVKLWSDTPVHSAYAGQGITAIQPFAHQFPRDGTLLLSGVHLKPAPWLKYTRFDKVLLWHNLSNQSQLFAVIEGVRALTGLAPELIFVSRLLQRSAALPGRIIPSLLNLELFTAVARARFEKPLDLQAAARPITVGRASRDVLDKHHPDDIALYKSLAARGMHVRIMGGTCLARGFQEEGALDGIELLPSGSESMPDFYRSLDAVFYRTGAFIESYGRVVLEAMGAGLPVVAHVRGGYAEKIEHGVSGFLIESQEQAYEALMALDQSASLRLSVGKAALHRSMEVHGPEAAERELAIYLRAS